MTAYSGSPSKPGNNNSYLNRYVENLGTNVTPPLRPQSSSKINSSLNIASPSHLKTKTSASNSSATVLSKKVESSVSKLKPSLPNKLVGKYTVDLSNYSKIELRYYEFLCRVSEVKIWIEAVIEEALPSEIELCVGDSLRNGVFLAKLTQRINPDLTTVIFPAGDKLQFKHTQNINAFFGLVEHVGVPDSFRFELQDLYNKKNIPQVFETLHILISMINKKWPGKTPALTNVSGQISFTKEEIAACKKTWPRIRDFKSLGTNINTTPASPEEPKEKRSGLIKDFNKFERPNIPVEEILVTPRKNITDANCSDFSNTPSPYNEVPKMSNLDVVVEKRKFTPIEPSLLGPTPSLEYSPIKNKSLSYYSPTISKYLTYDTEFYTRRSRAREEDLNYYQTFKYSPSHYSPMRRERMTEEQFLEKVVQLQNICRGVNTRFNLYIQKRLLNLFEQDIVRFQACLRGNKFRVLSSMYLPIRRAKIDVPHVEAVQSRIKGSRIRYKYDKLKFTLSRFSCTVELLQAYCRSKLLKTTVNTKLNDIEISHYPLTKLQSYIRASYVRKKVMSLNTKLNDERESIMKISAIIRGNVVRCSEDAILSAVHDVHKENISKLQSLIRGIFTRSCLASIIYSLGKENCNIIQLSACIRGNAVRHKVQSLFAPENNLSETVHDLQGLVRGILVRYTLDLVDDIVEYNNLALFQAFSRGALVRESLDQKSSFYKRNVRSVIMIQSWIRKSLQRSAYLELLDCPNPSLWAVKKFVHLLNGTATIEEVQNQLESCQASLDSENMKKERLLKSIRQQLNINGVLDKFGLLKDKDHELGISDSTIPKSKYQKYEKLFYMLQVDPSYWKLLYLKEPEFVAKNVYMTFGTVNQRMNDRERSYFTRFVCEMLQNAINEAPSIESFLDNRSQFWQTILQDFLRRESPEFFSIIVPVLDYLSDPVVDFESDPYKIYQEIHGFSSPQHCSPVDDASTKNKFIDNLRCLWHAIEMVAEIYTRKVHTIPVEIRYLCTKIFCYAADKNIEEIDSLRAISSILVNVFVSEYLVNREYYGYKDSNVQKNNQKIDILMKSLATVFEIKIFDGFLDPLNQYANEIKPHIKDVLYNVLVDPEYEQEGDRLIYLDMVSPSPKLELLTEKVLEISGKFEEYLNEFPEADILHDILEKNLDNSSFPRSGRVTLELDASAYRFLVSDDKMRKIYDQVKRAFVYMMQIEDVDTNLYDLSISTILPQDEPNFANFLEQNPKIRDDPMIQKLKPLKYFTLKNVTLKKIHELESTGTFCSSDNKLQNFLNDIANTIKNPNYAIDYVTQEIYITKETLTKISEMNHSLDIELSRLKKHVDHTIKDFQKAKDFSPVHKSKFGNFKNAVKKVQGRERSELQGMKFKWNTKQLYERGVLKTIRGEKLAELTVKVFGSSGPKFPDIIFKISTSDGSRFGIQMIDKRKGPDKRYSDDVDSFSFKDLIKTQVEPKIETWKLFHSNVVVNNSQLLHLIVSFFYKRNAL
ncbi:BAH_G0052420.mRNA.1.CDS.1 [Saccharomyces cerevisiae]|nr:BAH_G0052420.mRNA.1.CDS.1 [Saccharomyces cerevisiae]CAI7344437.1 BAH_G0052420.mRNA.1.CDS.1 [Saccharomyces cerevisiae]